MRAVVLAIEHVANHVLAVAGAEGSIAGRGCPSLELLATLGPEASPEVFLAQGQVRQIGAGGE